MRLARLVIVSVLDVFARLLRVTGLDDPSRSMLHYVSAARQVDLPAYEHRHFSGRTLLRGQGWRLQPSHSLVYSSRAPSTMSPRGSRHVWLRDRAQS